MTEGTMTTWDLLEAVVLESEFIAAAMARYTGIPLPDDERAGLLERVNERIDRREEYIRTLRIRFGLVEPVTDEEVDRVRRRVMATIEAETSA
jgi:hypothetical protein